MKIIVLGDIHGNLPALEACFEKAEQEGYDWIVHTGDVVGYGPYPEECIEFLHRRNIPGVRGNFDDNLGSGAESSAAGYTDEEELELAERSFRWTGEHLGLLPKRWLDNLPFSVRRDTGGRSLAVYHASPLDLFSCLPRELPDATWGEYGKAAGADIVVLGHLHRPFHHAVNGRHFINAGSVGRPGDGDPRTGYAVIETENGVRVSFPRFEYDVERTVRAVKQRGLPEELSQRLQQGL